MANWYLNSGSPGSGGYDGIAPSSAWRTIERPLQGSDNWLTLNDTSGGPVSGAGDIVWIYDGHAEVWDNVDLIRVLYSGSSDPNNPVIYRGDITGSQSWGSAGGGSRPSVTLAANNNCIFDGADSTHIRFEHIDFIVPDGTHTPTNFWDIDASTVEFYDCTFTRVYGRFQAPSGGAYSFEDCEIDWTRTTNQWASGMFFMSAGHLFTRRCEFTGAKFGIWNSSNRPTIWEGEDIIFNAPSVAGGSAIVLGGAGATNWSMHVDVNGIKVHADWANYVLNQSNGRRGATRITFMNWDDNPRIFKQYRPEGTITATETSADLNTGGGDQTTILEPTSLCNEYFGGMEWKGNYIWAPSGQSRTYSVWVKLDDGAGGAWSAYPTAAELVFEVGYFDTSSSVTRTWTASTDVVSSTSWTELEVAGINPSEDGFVQCRVLLKTNDGGTGERVLIDNRVRVT
jgi:hypothetical protein